MINNKTVLVDTGAWFALSDRSDQYHKHAAKIFPKLLTSFSYLTTTNLVIAETYILIRRMLGFNPAIHFLVNSSTSPRINKIYSGMEIEKAAEALLKKYKDHNFSYTDAVSFAVMKEYGIEQAFTFDQHFKSAGFKIIP